MNLSCGASRHGDVSMDNGMFAACTYINNMFTVPAGCELNEQAFTPSDLDHYSTWSQPSSFNLDEVQLSWPAIPTVLEDGVPRQSIKRIVSDHGFDNMKYVDPTYCSFFEKQPRAAYDAYYVENLRAIPHRECSWIVKRWIQCCDKAKQTRHPYYLGDPAKPSYWPPTRCRHDAPCKLRLSGIFAYPSSQINAYYLFRAIYIISTSLTV